MPEPEPECGVGGAYAQWSDWLTEYAVGRESVPLDSLPAVSIEQIGSVAAARLCQRCGEAMNLRLGCWSESFARDLERARSAQDLQVALRSARRRLDPLRALSSTELLFEELRMELGGCLEQALKEMQQDLERHAHAAGAEREVMLRVVREQPLDRALTIAAPDESGALPSSQQTRQILIG
ncbi:MAG: hypothetical protein ACRDJ3_05790 [Solirubrobacteraceae bacterium]